MNVYLFLNTHLYHYLLQDSSSNWLFASHCPLSFKCFEKSPPFFNRLYFSKPSVGRSPLTRDVSLISSISSPTLWSCNSFCPSDLFMMSELSSFKFLKPKQFLTGVAHGDQMPKPNGLSFQDDLAPSDLFLILIYALPSVYLIVLSVDSFLFFRWMIFSLIGSPYLFLEWLEADYSLSYF